MRNKLFPSLLITFLSLCTCFSSVKETFSQVYAAITSPDWIQCDTHGNEDVTGDSSDYKITGLSSYGTRVRTSKKYMIDGLTFDYDVNHLTAEEGERFNINGFYFCNNTDAYVAGDDSTKKAVYSITSKLAYSDQQDRFGIFAHLNIFEPGKNLENVKCYYDAEKKNKGFGYSDGTLVMSHHSDSDKDKGGLRFRFKKFDENTYKVTISELYSNSMWADKSFNHNYDSGKTFVFVNASDFDLDADGKAYLFCYGFKTDDASEACIPEIHFKNITNVEGCIVSFETNGADSIEPIVVEDGEKVTKPNDPTQKGKNFIGWFTESTLLNLFDFNTPITSDITLYAGWSIITLIVSFDTKGLVEIEDKTVAYGKTINAPKVTFDNDINFEGWFTSEDYVTEFDFKHTPIESDTVIYAKISKILPDRTPIIITISVVSSVAFIGIVVLVFYSIKEYKKKKIALVKINEIRVKFKEKNNDEVKK